MKLYAHKGKELGGAIWIDNHPRDLFLSWKDFQLLCETLNNYTTDLQTKPPKPKVKELERRLVSLWHQQDREVSERPE